MKSLNVFLTGASAGIGRATAEMLCERGHRVWGCARDTQRLPVHDNFSPIRLDLSDAAAVRTTFDAAERDSGGFDALVNNAGFATFAPLLDLPAEDFAAEWRVMVCAPLQLIQLAAPGLGARGGVVVNVSSLAAELPIPGMGGYSAAKAALASLSATLRLELAELEQSTGERMPRVVDVQPGDIDTAFNEHLARPRVAGKRLDWTERALAACVKHCTGAPGPEVVARAIVSTIEAGGAAASPRVVGDWSQTRVGPAALRLLPGALRERVLRRYYR